MSIHDALRSGELPDIVVACLFAVKASLDAITFSFDLGKCEIDFGGDAGYIEATNI